MEIEVQARRECLPRFGLLFREKLAGQAKTKELSLDLRIIAALLNRDNGNGELSLDMLGVFTGATTNGVAYAVKKLVATKLVVTRDSGRHRRYRLSPLLYYSGRPQGYAEVCKEYAEAISPEDAS